MHGFLIDVKIIMIRFGYAYDLILVGCYFIRKKKYLPVVRCAGMFFILLIQTFALLYLSGAAFSCPSEVGYFSDPCDDSKFYHCANYRGYHKGCAAPLVWDNQMSLCNWRKT